MAKPGPKPRKAVNPKLVGTKGGLWYGFSLSKHEPDRVREEFARLVRAIKIVGTYERIDPRFVEEAARIYDLRVQADEDIARDGMTLVTANGTRMPHPMLAVRNTYIMRTRALYNDMGLTASSAKLGDAKASDEETEGGWGNLIKVS